MSVQTGSRITICGYSFEGPFADLRNLRDQAGVYAILDYRTDGKWHVLDVGESDHVRTRVENHDRASCWELNRQGTLGYAAYYTPGWTADQRRALERRVRDEFRPPCGDR